MSLLKKNKRAENESYWKNLLQEWKKSGLSKTAFCTQREIKYASFLRWHRRLQSREQKSTTPAAFLPINLRPAVDAPLQQSNRIRINLGDEKCIDLPADTSPEQLRAVVSSL